MASTTDVAGPVALAGSRGRDGWPSVTAYKGKARALNLAELPPNIIQNVLTLVVTSAYDSPGMRSTWDDESELAFSHEVFKGLRIGNIMYAMGTVCTGWWQPVDEHPLWFNVFKFIDPHFSFQYIYERCMQDLNPQRRTAGGGGGSGGYPRLRHGATTFQILRNFFCVPCLVNRPLSLTYTRNLHNVPASVWIPPVPPANIKTHNLQTFISTTSLGLVLACGEHARIEGTCGICLREGSIPTPDCPYEPIVTEIEDYHPAFRISMAGTKSLGLAYAGGIIEPSERFCGAHAGPIMHAEHPPPYWPTPARDTLRNWTGYGNSPVDSQHRVDNICSGCRSRVLCGALDGSYPAGAGYSLLKWLGGEGFENADAEVRSLLESYTELGDGDLRVIVGCVMDKWWLNGNTRMREMVKFAVSAQRFGDSQRRRRKENEAKQKRRELREMSCLMDGEEELLMGYEYEEEEDEDEEMWDGEYIDDSDTDCANYAEEQQARELAMGDWSRLRILEGLWATPEDDHLADHSHNSKHGSAAMQASCVLPSPVLSQARPQPIRPYPRVPSKGLRDALTYAFKGALKNLVMPAMNSIVRRVVNEMCEGDVARAQVKVLEMFQWKGLELGEWLVRRLRELDTWYVPTAESATRRHERAHSDASISGSSQSSSSRSSEESSGGGSDSPSTLHTTPSPDLHLHHHSKLDTSPPPPAPTVTYTPIIHTIPWIPSVGALERCKDAKGCLERVFREACQALWTPGVGVACTCAMCVRSILSSARVQELLLAAASTVVPSNAAVASPTTTTTTVTNNTTTTAVVETGGGGGEEQKPVGGGGVKRSSTEVEDGEARLAKRQRTDSLDSERALADVRRLTAEREGTATADPPEVPDLELPDQEEQEQEQDAMLAFYAAERRRSKREDEWASDIEEEEEEYEEEEEEDERMWS